MKHLVWFSTALLCAACGDDLPGAPDAGTPDTPGPVDASPDAPAYTPPTPFGFMLSTDGPDQMQAATAGPGGTFYAAGFASQSAAGDKLVVVTRRTPTGPDATFGTAGVATTALVATGSADEIDVATQADGKVIVSATILDGGQRNIAVTRLNADGTLDTTFGTAGVTVLDLSNGAVNDSSRGLAIDGDDNIFIHAVQLAEGDITGMVGVPRTDSEFAVVKLTPAGALDTAWGTGGKHLTDIFIGGAHTSATARGIHALADGSVIAGGYSNAIGTTQAVLYKLTPAGAKDAAFATGGLFHDTVLAIQTEIYNFAIHGNSLVTAGYGRDSGADNVWVSLRFDVTTGARDTTWGGATNGAVLVDPSGGTQSNNCRNAIALPGGKTLLVGSTGPSNMATQDAALAILTSTGQLDTTYGTGIVTYQLGGNGNDQFWGAAVNGDKALVVGYQGGGASPATQNDDAYGAILTLE